MSQRKFTLLRHDRVIDMDRLQKFLLSHGLSWLILGAATCVLCPHGWTQELTPTSTKSAGGTVTAEIDSSVADSVVASPSVDFLDSGELPTSLEQLRMMQTRVKSVAERVKDATVSITMRTGQGTGVLVSADGVILTAAHVIGRPRQMALITFRDGSRARAVTLGVEAGKDSGMLKVLDMIKLPSKDDAETAGDASDDGAENKNKDETNGESGSPDNPSTNQSEGESTKDEGASDSKDDPSTDNTKKTDIVERAFQNEDLPFFDYLDIGVSEALENGQWVIAVGHPGGLDADRGMVVRVGRIINQRDAAIRTDCTLVGGDSGGPLVDMSGNVIAIHSRIGSRIQDNIHVPVDVFSDTWDELAQGLKLGERGRLGLSIRLDTNIVSKVVPKGPADEAGINEGDIITAVNALRIKDKKGLAAALSVFVPYQKVNVTVKRGSREIELEVTLTDGDMLKSMETRQTRQSRQRGGKWRHP